MHIKNFECKVRVHDLEKFENKLLTLKPILGGVDNQTDTYFKVLKGRLKLREGNIENALINYDREDTSDAKRSDIIIYQHQPNKALKDILSLQLGVKAVVNKQRKIYYIDNVKFHFDTVENLGTFIEVEAIDNTGMLAIETLKAQCEKYFDFLNLDSAALIGKSYCDMIEAL